MYQKIHLTLFTTLIIANGSLVIILQCWQNENFKFSHHHLLCSHSVATCRVHFNWMTKYNTRVLTSSTLLAHELARVVNHVSLTPPLRAPVKQSSSICLIEFHILPKNISDEQQLRKTRLAKHITTYRIYHKTSYLSHSPRPPLPHAFTPHCQSCQILFMKIFLHCFLFAFIHIVFTRVYITPLLTNRSSAKTASLVKHI